MCDSGFSETEGFSTLDTISSMVMDSRQADKIKE
jgi:hypothetical protein